jgi:hypothetical protein
LALGQPPVIRLDKNIPMASGCGRFIRCSKRMLTTEQINTIHRLHFAEHWSMRKPSANSAKQWPWILS